MNFPHDFSAIPKPITPADVGDKGAAAIESLAEKGYEVQLGIEKIRIAELIAMAQEPGMQEYVSKDAKQRFGDEAAMSAWFSKGRALFLLVQLRDDGAKKLAGYGWTGQATEARVPGGETTFAIRVGHASQGQGLATPFARVIIEATATIFGAQKFWLETWASNGGAVHVYHKLGFQDVGERVSERPSQAAGGTVSDTRLFMSLPDVRL